MLPMICNEPARPNRLATDHALADRLEGLIARRSWGQIRDLHVECFEDRILLQGRSRTHHAKQLAQEAALEETGGHPVLSNKIVVCS